MELLPRRMEVGQAGVTYTDRRGIEVAWQKVVKSERLRPERAHDKGGWWVSFPWPSCNSEATGLGPVQNRCS